MLEKINKIWEPIIEDFVSENVYMAEQLVDWYPSGQMEIIIRLKDGCKYRYDWLEKTITLISSPIDDELMDEESWRSKFGHRLYLKMRKFGISQEDLADATSISVVTISRYINGKATPSTYNMEKIARALRCSISELTNVR